MNAAWERFVQYGFVKTTMAEIARDCGMSAANLYMFQSNKSVGLFCFSRSAKGTGLPISLAPWMGYGVLRLDQKPPHGM